jgi:hypothetical protein
MLDLMGTFRKLVAFGLAAALGFAAGRLMPSGNHRTDKWELAEAVPTHSSECVEARAEEQEAFALALAILQNSGRAREAGQNVLWLDIGAQRFLGHGIYRSAGGKSFRVCPPEGVYEQVADVLTKHRQLEGQLVEYQLNLAAKFTRPDAYIVKSVADFAFSATPQESEYFKLRDIRLASSYADVAFRKMSGRDSLGTGAAQVAVAAGHPDALQHADTLMTEILEPLAKNDVVPFETRNRLYELAYAISLGGDDARKHVAPLKDLMGRKVQSWAGHFGMVELHPKRMCRVLAEIEGKTAMQAFPYCLDDKTPFEQ